MVSTLAGADARAKLMSAKGPRDVTLLASHPLKLPALSGVGLQLNPAINRGQMNTQSHRPILRALDRLGRGLLGIWCVVGPRVILGVL
jgi:hypothetical protein